MTQAAIKNPHYEKIGGEEGVRQLVELFYEKMDTLPEVRTIRNMHAQDLTGAKRKLFRFLSGWLGGPALYTPHGQPPRLGQKHAPFPIGHAERDQWLLCMQLAMAELQLEPSLQQELMASFTRLATSLMNHQHTHAGKRLNEQVVLLEYPFKS
ncbi:group II truncated hemoglobin [Thioflexithrix psekupsensis]|uniref:Globin n=1 Tax=Thioflexithrix psekupsensis TaxID=1570016 RepID=A0A251X8L7_9GAMM|nr:group II truncated hemoglobin [Thioflexithrix psekupsensis]OUD14124.1 hypothetical protein TPSD3_07255 [Thioflexithrix psekupsensis]